MKDSLHIEIFSCDGNFTCEAGCGTDWSDPEVQEHAKAELRHRFGDSITLNFISCGESNDKYGSDRDHSRLIVNGEIRLSGRFDLRQVIYIIEAQQEIGALH